MTNNWLVASLTFAALCSVNSNFTFASESASTKAAKSTSSADTKSDSSSSKKSVEPGHSKSKMGKHHKSDSQTRGPHDNMNDHHKSGHFFTDAKFGKLDVKAHENLFISGLPNKETLDAMKLGGVKLLIDVRPLDEVGNEFPKLVKAAGIEFESKPVFLKDGTVDLKAVDAITELHMKNHDHGHVIACTMGARSSGWVSLHLVKHHKMPVEEAIKIGKEAYLNDDLATKIREVSK